MPKSKNGDHFLSPTIPKFGGKETTRTLFTNVESILSKHQDVFVFELGRGISAERSQQFEMHLHLRNNLWGTNNLRNANTGEAA